jgi:pheromone shutdown-related protein TraB
MDSVAAPSATAEPVVEVERDGVHYTLLGTAHVSRKSAERAIELASDARFDTVAVELCASRAQAMRDRDAWRKLDLFQVIRSGKTGMVMASLALGAYQRRIADQFGIEPGAEMRGAMDASDARGARVWLIDRDVGTTLKRVGASVGFWQRMNLFSGLLASLLSRDQVSESEIEKLKEGDLLESTFSEFAAQSPKLYEPLIAERDRFMALKLREQAADHGANNVLAVVGAGHLKGLAAALADGHDAPAPALAKLNEIPPPSGFARAFPWLLLAFIVGGFAYGFWKSPELGWNLVLTWILTTGSFAAIGTLLAFGHPLTILSAFLGAPLTTLHPGIGIGLITGLVELWCRKPSVDDFERLRDDVLTLKGWWRNRVARVFLVFALSTLGAMIGLYTAGFQIARAL